MAKDRMRQGLPHFAALPFELLDDPRVMNAIDLTVYAALRRFADFTKGDRCFPALETIATKARCSERSAQYSLRRLEGLGWLAVIRKSGRHNVNVYQVRLNKGCTTCTISSKKVQETTRKGAPGAHELETLTRDKKTASVDAAPKSPKGQSPQPFITDLFFKKYAVRPGGKPPWGKKEGALLKGDLQRLGIEKLSRLVFLFFDDPPRNVADFAVKAGWTYGVLHSQLPKLEAAVAERKARLSLLRVCPHCGREQEHTSPDCLYCNKPLKEAARVAAG